MLWLCVLTSIFIRWVTPFDPMMLYPPLFWRSPLPERSAWFMTMRRSVRTAQKARLF
jgi:hypothetical protein